MEILSDIWIKTLLMLAISGSMAGLAIGVWLAINPKSFFNFNQFFSQWISTRKAVKPLVMPHLLERFFYRHHRVIGLMILAGAVYVLYVFAVRHDRLWLASTFIVSGHTRNATEWLLPGLGIVAIAGAVFALVIGGFLLIRPSLLKGFEAWANRWISARKPTKSLDIMRTGPDRFLARHPRATAGLLILGSGYALLRLSTFIQTVN